MIPETYGARAPILSGFGLQPLPIVRGGKRPAIPNWADTELNVEALAQQYSDHGVGLRLGHRLGDGYLIAVDIDVRDPEPAEVISADADEILGKAPERVGMPPKRLRLYRLEHREDLYPPSKSSSDIYWDFLGRKNQIEILASGQQAVIHGIHPDTGEPYTWSEELTGDIALITHDQLAEFMIRFRRRSRDEFGWDTIDPEKSPRTRSEPRDGVGDGEASAPATTRARLCLAVLSADDYQDWIDAGHHLKAEFGEDGFDLWHDWSGRSDVGTYEGIEQCREKWDSFSPERSHGLHSLQAMAEKQSGMALPGCLPSEFDDVSDTPEKKSDPSVIRPYMLTSVRELLSSYTPTDWLIDGWLPTDCLTLLHGESTAGKSLIAIDWSCCIATGRPWMGHETKAASVVYLAGEGHGGISKRFRVWADIHGVEPQRIFVSNRGIGLTEKETLEEIVIERLDEIRPKLIVIDTMSRHMLSGDENNTADVAVFLAALDALRLRYRAAVLVVHHPGHGAKDRARGSSALRPAVDCEYQLSKDPRILSVRKMKDGAEPEPKALDLLIQDLEWLDAKGRPETSGVLVSAGEVAPRPHRITPAQRVALEALCAAPTVPKPDDAPPDAPPTVTTLDAWRAAFVERHTGDNPDSKTRAFRRARTDLVDCRLIEVWQDHYWPTQEGANR